MYLVGLIVRDHRHHRGRVAAVALGMWPGVELLSRQAWLALEAEIRAALSLQEEPFIEWQPWLLASGVLPS